MFKFEQVEELNDKELMVLGLFASGLDAYAVAIESKYSIRTVKWYQLQIYQKLSVHKLHQAVVWYLVIYKNSDK